MKITIPKEVTLSIVIIGISILLIPFFVLADDGHDETVPHSDVAEVQVISAEPEVFEVVGVEEEIEHEVGDGHTDHTHVVLPTIWWKSTTWWALFIISLLLMTILSFGVYKYLENKE